MGKVDRREGKEDIPGGGCEWEQEEIRDGPLRGALHVKWDPEG